MAIGFNLPGIPGQIRGTAEEAGAVPDLGQAMMQGFRSNLENVQGYPRQLAQQLLSNQLANTINRAKAKYAEQSEAANLQSKLLENQYYPQIQQSNLATAALARQGQSLANQMTSFNLEKAKYQKQIFDNLMNQYNIPANQAHGIAANIVANDPNVQAQQNALETNQAQSELNIPFRLQQPQQSRQPQKLGYQQNLQQAPQVTQPTYNSFADFVMQPEVRQNPVYANAIKSMTGIDITKETPAEKRIRDAQDKAQGLITEANIKKAQGYESDLPLLNDKINQINKMIEIVQNKPHLFGKLNRFKTAISDDADIGVFKDLVGDFVGTKEAEFSQRGNQAALKYSIGLKPSFSDTPEQNLGKLNSALQKLLTQRDRGNLNYARLTGSDPMELYQGTDYYTPEHTTLKEKLNKIEPKLTNQQPMQQIQSPQFTFNEENNLPAAQKIQQGLNRWKNFGGDIAKGFTEEGKGELAALLGKRYEPQLKGNIQRLSALAADLAPAAIGGALGAPLGPLGSLAGAAIGEAATTQGGWRERALAAGSTVALAKAFPFAVKTLKASAKEIGALMKSPNPLKTVLNDIQGRYDTLYNKSIGLYDKVLNQSVERKITPIKPSEKIINQISEHIPDEPRFNVIMQGVRNGDYGAIHDLQSYLRKRGEIMYDNPEQKTHKLGAEFLGWRNHLNEEVEQHFKKTGNKDLANDLKEAREIYKDLMQTYHPDNAPELSALFRTGIKRHPKNLFEFFTAKDEPMREFLHKHPALKKAHEIEGLREKGYAKGKKIFMGVSGIGTAGYLGKKAYETLFND